MREKSFLFYGHQIQILCHSALWCADLKYVFVSCGQDASQNYVFKNIHKCVDRALKQCQRLLCERLLSNVHLTVHV